MSNDEEEKGFKFTDKRRLSPETGEVHKEEALKETPKPAETPGTAPPPENPPPSPEVNFIGFILGLSTQAVMLMGDLPDPESGEKVQDLPAVRQLIDILGMLREKTAGNLEKDEEKLFDKILFDLRTQFVEKSKKK